MRLKNLNKYLILLGAFIIFCSMSTISTIASNPWDTWNSTLNPEDVATFMGIGLTICALIIIIPLIVAILIAVWLYKDAEKRGKEGIIWVIFLLIASIFLSIIGLIIVVVVWLAIRPPIGGVAAKIERKCPFCGRVIPEDARSCPYCNKKFEE